MFSLPALECEFQFTQISFSASVNFNCASMFSATVESMFSV
jgi:hypothetical protein